MAQLNIITDEFIRHEAPNTSAVDNGRKLSQKGSFSELCKTQDDTLIFAKCSGSGKKPYSASVDVSGDSPVYRCSCPSRQIPCKHCVGLMFEYTANKTFTVSEVPEDIARKREKIAQRAEKAADPTAKKAGKPNKAAAEKKLRKQLEGLELAETFVRDIFSRGVSSVNSASARQYKDLAKQLGDHYLPEPQAIMMQIVSQALVLSDKADDNMTDNITSLCVKLSSTVKKSREYISSKLESGEVLPEDSILYEAMGGVWKLTQLKEIGLYKENARIMQLSFNVIDDAIHKALIDTAWWIDLDSGEISRTENIRPVKSLKHIKAEDSSFGIFKIKELYKYPGGLNRRIRWESAEISEPDSSIYTQIISMAEPSIADAVKKAKNDLKNTLSEPSVCVLLPYDSIEFAVNDGHPVLRYGDETIGMRSFEGYQNTCGVLRATNSAVHKNGALAGMLFYDSRERKIFLCPLTLVTGDGIIRLC